MDKRIYKINFYYKNHGKQVQKTEAISGVSIKAVIEGILSDYDGVVIVKGSTMYLNKLIMTKEDSTYLDLCEHAT